MITCSSHNVQAKVYIGVSECISVDLNIPKRDHIFIRPSSPEVATLFPFMFHFTEHITPVWATTFFSKRPDLLRNSKLPLDEPITSISENFPELVLCIGQHCMHTGKYPFGNM
ncbi:hypothetical protein LOD99_1833 [Oopsacas minuta]|uniref:Uncharacterized protein n=1 Tax=Oopsacas minuta TaxID=111878 RepID=A0AAV7K367_9METZ|nr:hypothetical protein LOD99_1833 [Oopsacas minuta]